MPVVSVAEKTRVSCLARCLRSESCGHRYVRRITGVESEPAPGLGLGMMLSAVAVEVLLDAEGVYQVAGQAYLDYLRGDRLREQGADQEWVVRQHSAQAGSASSASQNMAAETL